MAPQTTDKSNDFFFGMFPLTALFALNKVLICYKLVKDVIYKNLEALYVASGEV